MRSHAIIPAVLGLVVVAATAGASPVVVMNDNLAGCVDPVLDSYVIGQRTVRAELTLRAAGPGTSQPCTCRGGTYYVSVYPSDRALTAGSAVYTAPRPYRKNLHYGVLPRRPLPYSETLTFPLFTRNNSPYAFYNLVLGCP